MRLASPPRRARHLRLTLLTTPSALRPAVPHATGSGSWQLSSPVSKHHAKEQSSWDLKLFWFFCSRSSLMDNFRGRGQGNRHFLTSEDQKDNHNSHHQIGKGFFILLFFPFLAYICNVIYIWSSLNCRQVHQYISTSFCKVCKKKDKYVHLGTCFWDIF